MITLVASTPTKLIKAAKKERFFLIHSMSTTGTAVAYSPDGLGNDAGQGGFCIVEYQSVVLRLPAGEEIFAMDAGTPTVSIAEVQGTNTNAITLY